MLSQIIKGDKKMRKKILYLLSISLGIFATVFFISCGGGSGGSSSGNVSTGSVALYVTDSPKDDYKRVEISIKNLILKIANISGKEIEIITDEQRVRPGNSEVERLFCENKKLVDNTNWKPDYDLDKGLKETIDWFKKNLDVYKPEIYNV
jgi:hypothetical protein